MPGDLREAGAYLSLLGPPPRGGLSVCMRSVARGSAPRVQVPALPHLLSENFFTCWPFLKCFLALGL